MPAGQALLLALTLLVASAIVPQGEAGVVYWNMETAAPTLNDVPALAVGSLVRGQAADGTLLGSAAASTGYSFLLDGTSLAASGDNNAGVAARGGPLSSGSSSFVEFSLTNASSTAMAVGAIGFASRSTTSGPTAYAILTSADGFAAAVPDGSGSLPITATWQYYSSVFTSPLPLAPAATTQVRIYGHGGSASSIVSTVNWRLDDLQIVIVPEPSAWAIAAGGLGGTILSLNRRRRTRSTAPRGFSLTELLVAIAIVGLLVGLLLPTVQAARESSRRTHCQNNLRQIALGVLAYENTNGRFPAAAIVSEGSNTPTCSGCWNPWAEARLPPGSAADGKHGTSWILETLPHLEQAAVFNAWNRATNVLGNAPIAQTDIALLYCPSRRSGIRVGAGDHRNLVDASWRGGGNDYGGCYGRLDGFLNSTAADHRFADRGTPIPGSVGRRESVFLPNAGVAAATVSDGLSTTIMLGEMQRLRPIPGATSAADTANRTSHDGWAAGGVATLFTTSTDPTHSNPGGMNNLFFESPGSDHPGGGSFAMADGSVHWIGEFIDARDNNAVFPLLGSMRDGQVATLALAR